MNKMEEILKAAKELYGQTTRVEIHEGEVESRRGTAVMEAVADEMMNEDDMMNELANDIGSLFGIEVDILDK